MSEGTAGSSTRGRGRGTTREGDGSKAKGQNSPGREQPPKDTGAGPAGGRGRQGSSTGSRFGGTTGEGGRTGREAGGKPTGQNAPGREQAPRGHPGPGRPNKALPYPTPREDSGPRGWPLLERRPYLQGHSAREVHGCARTSSPGLLPGKLTTLVGGAAAGGAGGGGWWWWRRWGRSSSSSRWSGRRVAVRANGDTGGERWRWCSSKWRRQRR